MLTFLKQKFSYILAGCLLAFGFGLFFVGGNVVYAQNNGAGSGGTGTTQGSPAGTPNNTGGAQTPQTPQTPPPPPAEQSTLEKLLGISNSIPNAIISGLLSMINLLLIWIIQLIGGLMSIFTLILTKVAQYNGFSNQQQVIGGWTIVRDLINSFFIVVLIAIAISTIIRFQQFNFRSTLPRLILAAFLVNFSRTICLIAINFSTSVMTTFVTPLEGLIPAFGVGLRLPALIAMRDTTLGRLYNDGSLTFPSLTTDITKQTNEYGLLISGIISSVLAIIMMMLALGGIATFAIILIFRILTLWFLMILSPLAFFLWGVPGRASGYWGQWLDEFVKHIIVGPVAAFFLYIIIYFYLSNLQSKEGAVYGIKLGTVTVPQVTQTLASRVDVFLGYLISLGLMFIAFEIIQQMGVRGGQFAARVGVEGIGKGGLRMMKSGLGMANDYLYSKGLSVKPLRAVEGIRAGIAARQENWMREGDIIAAQRVADSEAAGNGFRSILWAGVGGNADFFEKNGIGSMIKRSMAAPITSTLSAGRSAVSGAKAAGSAIAGAKQSFDQMGRFRGVGRAIGRGAAGAPEAIKGAAKKGVEAVGGAIAERARSIWTMSAGTDELYDEMDAIDNRSKLRSGLTDVGTGFDGFNKAGLQELSNDVAMYNKSQQVASLDAQISALDAQWRANGGLLNDPILQQRQEAQAQRDQLAGEVGNWASTASADRQSRAAANAGQVETIGNALKLYENTQANAGESLGEIRAKVTASEASDKSTKTRLATEAAARLMRASSATSGVKANLAIKAQEYQSKRYKQFESHDAQVLANDLLGHMNPQDVPEFLGVLKESVKQDNFPDVLEKLNIDGINATWGGMKNFKNLIQERMGVDDATVAEIMYEIQGGMKKNKQYELNALAQVDARGRPRMLEDDDHFKGVKKAVKGDGAATIIKQNPKKLGVVQKVGGKESLILNNEIKEALMEDLEGIKQAFSTSIRGEAKTLIVNAIRQEIINAGKQREFSGSPAFKNLRLDQP